ncbi:Cys-tRNA(Pro) deacylase [Alkalibacterium pelagium]|uniref:Cys-tRNA(Pro)/Cys-tRNA(Cys) deacylase n=1 Tax=Alkalibacterium pelagium TaxID=426702 RepID=A0A1H7LZ87_9LACT|nr:Cys-tRNA(Pro) deacylase [Alkalibacterium pelagium]GEN51008.1 Cys-tRNA(Pro)/Cys-tRNA(Cys) deacylase [Alkalibacterium pelagium]SEL04169.1 Cys-tRNA(Pro)/Cys-tRNA(Cys) deacylase [Alkalibacterium pelagium]
MSKQVKTNVIRQLEQQNIDYKEHHYFGSDVSSGTDVARKMGNDPAKQFKTLVTRGKSNEVYVFVIPVNEELDLKKAAQSVDEKSVSMIKEKELLPLTGYVHGGCSPIGMKKTFQTVLHSSAEQFETIIFSAGKVGVSVEINAEDLMRLIDGHIANVVKS